MTKALVVNTWDLIHDFRVVHCPSNNVKQGKKFLADTGVHCSVGLRGREETPKASPEVTETLADSGPPLTSQFIVCPHPK